MNHPTPEFQDLQGDYVSNVERLEQHAERLSLGHDLAQEPVSLQAASLPGAEGVIPTRFTDQDFESLHRLAREPITHSAQHMKEPSRSESHSMAQGNVAATDAEIQQDPQFADLGQLYDLAASDVRHVSVTTSESSSQHVEEALAELGSTHVDVSNLSGGTGEGAQRVSDEPADATQAALVYYPAPIPVMLSLPPRLSQRSQIKAILPKDANPDRTTVAFGTDEELPGASTSMLSHAEELKPYEKNSGAPTLQKLNNSAVKTFERLLDASVYAPVSAFTDHPIVGPSGAEIYRTSDGRKLKSDLEFNDSQALDNDLETPISVLGTGRNRIPDKAWITPDSDAVSAYEQHPRDVVSPAFETSKPTTLLAELESRKQEQHSRNKSAANAFPKGMHATLLQLDQVAQRQRESRNIKPTTLVWQAGPGFEEADHIDEDAPLALLPQLQSNKVSAGSQGALGIQERRQLDDTEPLSARRSRLTGLHTDNRRNVDTLASAPNLRQYGVAGKTKFEGEGETLAQRKRRLHIEGTIPAGKGVSGELTAEMLGEFGIPGSDSVMTSGRRSGGRLHSEDTETLAQRQRRLQTTAPLLNH